LFYFGEVKLVYNWFVVYGLVLHNAHIYTFKLYSYMFR